MIKDVETIVRIGPAGAGQLVLSENCTDDGLFWNAMGLPDWELRYNYAPPSNYVAGNVLLSVVEDSGAVAMNVVARAPSLEALEVHKTRLRNALTAWPGQFSIEVIDENGTTVIAGPWQTFPTKPKWGEVDPNKLGLRFAEATFSLPVNP